MKVIVLSEAPRGMSVIQLLQHIGLKRLLGMLTAVLLIASTTLHAAAPDLPDIGDASAVNLSPEQEASIGKQMMRDLRRKKLVNEDVALTQYIQGLGHRLSAYSGADQQPFTFFIVNDPAINAFAMPGGYIGVNAGLIVATESENELASVLAHEISHVTQHHMARSYAKASKMSLPMAMAMIGAIIVGSHNPQAGEAALMASMAGSAQMQLDFTRANEQEADRVGIQLLAKSGFDPSGMASFFQRLQKDTRYYGSMPEFLSTHPVTENRISEAEDRAAQYPPVTVRDSDNYHTTKAQLRVALSRDNDDLIARTCDNIDKGRYSNLAEEQFTYALALSAGTKYAEARTVLQTLLKQNPGSIAYMHALAQTESLAGNNRDALQLYRRGLELYPGNIELTLYYAKTLLQANQAASAVDVMQKYTRTHPDMPEGFKLLAEAQSSVGHEASSHVAFAEYYALHDEFHSAIDQLNLALLVKDKDFYQTSRIEARLAQFKQLDQQEKTDSKE